MCNYIFSTHMVSMHHREEIRVITVTFKYTLTFEIFSLVFPKKNVFLVHIRVSRMCTLPSESTPAGQKATAGGEEFLNINFKQCLNKVQAFGPEANWPDVIWCWPAVGNPAQMWGTLGCFLFENLYQSIDRWRTSSHMAKECISYCRIKDLAVTVHVNMNMGACVGVIL